ncbi:DsbA family protein [Thalassovita sp.]|uniref:DsbA family protein n=1 Tax=Thalassovita sp. TaxID=1979401 RepID=UPI0029DE59DA|nr:DsbA family protein [Thalassovita sp.]
MKRLLASAALIVAGLAAPAHAFDITSMSDAERAALRSEIRAYLMDNPEVIVEAYSVYEQRQQAAQAQAEGQMITAYAGQIFDDPNSWVGGNPQGDITLVEFMDYRCGYCRKAFEEVEQLIESDGNIRFVVKEFPILGDQSVLASRFAIATRMVAGDDAYKAAHDALITFKGNITEKSLSNIADKLNLDGKAIIAKMDAPEVTQVIADAHQLAGVLQISGTPTFVLKDELLRGYVPLANMQKLVAAAREN